MFYIKVNATFVDLPNDLSIELILENPLFLQDRIPVPYTTSADFPLTPSNKKLLDNPTRINNIGRVWEYDGAVMGYGVRPLYYGLLIIREIGGKLSWNFQASDDLERLKKPMHEIDWGTVNFGEATYAQRLNPKWAVNMPDASVDPAMQVYKEYWESVHADEQPYSAGVIKDKGEQIPSSFNDNDILEYIYALYGQNQFFNAYSNEFDAIIPVEQNPSNPSDFIRYAHPVMYPQMRAYHILKILLNLADVDNPFSEAGLRKVVITSHFHPNFRDDLISKWNGLLLDNDYPGSSSPAEDLLLKISSYQPQMPANEILKSLLNLVAGTLFPYQEGGQLVYKVKLAKDIILDTDYQDWNKNLVTKLVLSREPAQNYIYGYDDFNEGPAPVDPSIIRGTIEEMVESAVTSPTKEQLFYVQTTDQMILKYMAPKVNAASPTRWQYEVKHSGFDRPESAEGYKITSVLSPMKMIPAINITTLYNSISPEFSQAYLPIYEGARKVDYKPHLMISWGIQTNHLFFPRDIPFLSYHNYDAAGNRLGDISLQWNGPDGLLANFHTGFQAWTQRDKILAYGEFIISPYFIKDIDLAKKLLVRGKLWWIKKLTIPMTKKKIEPIRADLIEAALAADEIDGGSGSGGSGSGGSTPITLGTCYTIEVVKNTFDVENDSFQIQFRAPGGMLDTLDYYNFDQYFDEIAIVYVYFCSDISPILIYEGQPVDDDAIPGVFITSGGSCTTDGQCIPSGSGTGPGSGSAGSGSGSGGGGIPGSGTCYAITIDSFFDPQADYFNITLTRPGSSQTTAAYDTFDSLDSGDETVIYICSEEVPFFTQSGTVVASVNGVTMTSGGSCTTDGECSA